MTDVKFFVLVYIWGAETSLWFYLWAMPKVNPSEDRVFFSLLLSSLFPKRKESKVFELFVKLTSGTD